MCGVGDPRSANDRGTPLPVSWRCTEHSVRVGHSITHGPSQQWDSMVAVAVLLSVAIIEGSTARPQYDDYNDYDPYDVPADQAAPSQGENQCLGTLHIGSLSVTCKEDDSQPNNHQNTSN